MNGDYAIASNILTEFLEVAIHVILHSRQVYPETIFKKVRKYGIPVQMSTHPEVNLYITKCLRSAQQLIQQNKLRKLVVCIRDQYGVPFQRFIFDIIKLGEISESDPYYIVGEQSLRAFCLKVATLECIPSPINTEATYAIQLLTTEPASIELARNQDLQDFPFVEVDATHGRIDSPAIIPIRTIDTDYLLLQIYFEK